MEKPTETAIYHSLDAEDIFALFSSSAKGLREDEVTQRRLTYGTNELSKKKRNSPLMVLLRQIHSPLVYIVLVAALVSFLIGHTVDAIFIGIVVAINTIVGFVQEYKAERALEQLQNSVKILAKVLRDGNKQERESRELVPGDIVFLEAGDRVPADGRLIEGHELSANEAALTGESSPIHKKTDAVSEDVVLPERTSMVYAGSIIESGTATFIVTATGKYTEIGRISSLVEGTEEVQTPLQKKFTELSRLIVIFILFVIGLFIIIGLLEGKAFDEVFVPSVALVVSTIPEGLLPAVLVILVLGMRRLAKQKALVRKLNASETMGSIDIICMDKTGTLTKGKMNVSTVITPDLEKTRHVTQLKNVYQAHDPSSHLSVLQVAALVNNAFIENPDEDPAEWRVHGRFTDRALLLGARLAGVNAKKLEEGMTLIEEVPFSSDIKYASRIYERTDGSKIVYAIGAPEVIEERCDHVLINGERAELSTPEAREMIDLSEKATENGARVLACARTIISGKDYASHGSLTPEERTNGLGLLGYVTLRDPVRKDVRQSVETAQKAGIRPIIITGDHKKTAQAIVREIGIPVPDKNVYVGTDVDGMDDSVLSQTVKTAQIFARVVPEHKIRIIRALQKHDHVVAMVGDGINDAPALKAADVGIAVGSGTDIAKEVSDIVLVDSSFSVIVQAIKQGRLIFENIRRVIIYLIADDFSELFLFFTAVFFGLPLPLLAVQILWINLVEDSFPGIALTTEKDAKGLMEDKPRKLSEPILSPAHKRFIASVFVITSAAAAGVYFWALNMYPENIDYVRTLTFAIIAFDSLMFAYVVRSMRTTVFRLSIFSNMTLNIAVLISAVLLVVGIHLPVFNSLLGTVPLAGSEWILIGVVTFCELILMELAKWIFPVRQNYTQGAESV